MRYPKLRELREAVKALVKGPYTTKFPKEPHLPFQRFRGRPEFSSKDCIGCGACVQVCPSGALSMRDEGDNRILQIRWDICIFCGQCQANCLTEKGIRLSQEFDFATTDKREELKQEIEKPLVICQCCGNIIAPYDQILWVSERLGPLTFSNPTLMLFYLQRQNLSLDELTKDMSRYIKAGKVKKELLRVDRIRILCPRCRREAVLKS